MGRGEGKARPVRRPGGEVWEAWKMLKVIGIAGSARREGNSSTLLKAVLAGATSAGARTECVYLNELNFRGCQGCTPCTEDATCRIKDELTPVLAAVRAADIWVLAAPIYFDGVCGQMKLFFDRLHHLINQAGKTKKLLPGKRAAAVVITYEDKPRDDYLDVARRMVYYLGWMGDFDPTEILVGARLRPPDAARARPELLAEAEELGRRLVEGLTRRRAGRAGQA